MHIEGLIIKYSLGLGFVIITLVFGIKIVLLLSTVAKLKAAAFLASHSWLGNLVDFVKEGF